ncbi:exo-alpha-sialidase [candidate division WOR-3 bacterium]|nr:exo-alpha-sialidase [candidate division WOR-3 bacterium]
MSITKALFCAGIVVVSAPHAQEYEFGSRIRLSDSANTGFSSGHTVVVESSLVVVVWMGTQESGNQPHIYSSRSANGGATFQAPVRVDSNPLGGWAWYPSLALDSGGSLYCAWQESSATGLHAYCAKSTNGGQSYFQRARIDGPEGIFPQAPVLACDWLGVVYATWTDFPDTTLTSYAVFFAKSVDSGRTFSPAKRLSPDIPRLRAGVSTLAADRRGTVHVAWRDDREDISRAYFHVYYTKSTDGGSSFLPETRVDLAGGTHGTFPSVAVDSAGTNIWIVYKDRSSGDHQVYLSRSTDGGASFFGHTRVDSLQLGPSDVPNIAFAEPQRIFVTWHQANPSGTYPQVYFRCSFDGGTSFSGIYKLNTASSTHGGNPLLAADPQSSVYISWWEARPTTYGVYFASGFPRTGPIAEHPVGPVAGSAVRGPIPNPAAGKVCFSAARAGDGIASLTVFNAAGRCVWFTDACSETIRWDLRTREGRRVSPGVYLYRCEVRHGGERPEHWRGTVTVIE